MILFAWLITCEGFFIFFCSAVRFIYHEAMLYVKILSITDLCKTEFGRYLNGRSFETVLTAAKRGV